MAADSPGPPCFVRERGQKRRRIQRKHTTILVSGLLGLSCHRWAHRVRHLPGEEVAVVARAVQRHCPYDGLRPLADPDRLTVEVYVDYECPGCKTFQSTAFATLTSMVAKNQITLVYHRSRCSMS